MRKHKVLFFLLLIMLPLGLLFSQSQDGPSDETPDIEEDWEIYETDLYMAGDQTFTITLGTIFPVLFVNGGKAIEHNLKPPVGGAGSLIYTYFLTSHIFLGMDVGFMFNTTLGRNSVFIIPIGVKTGYQFNIRRFDIPLNFTLGMNWHRYLNETYYGLLMKGGAGAYFRLNSLWSFGMTTDWCWLPEWTDDKKKNVHGNIIELKLAARYHF